MAEAIRGVDLVVIPSKWEACPLLPMEVLVAGRPLLGSDCIGMKEVTFDTPALIFPSGSLEMLVQKVKEFEANRLQIDAQCDAFRETAAKRFDVRGTASALSTLFDSVLAEKGKRP